MNAPVIHTDKPIPRHSSKGYEALLTPDALLFLADLERRFGPQRRILLENRRLQQERFDDGELPTQPLETTHVRNSTWEVAPCPPALRDRRINMRDYAREALSLKTEKKTYTLNEDTATMLVRPRGWHLEENNITVDNKPMSASLCDFGLHIFHNGKLLAENGRGPFYYLPKIENYQEARLWNDVFNFSQAVLDIPNGTIKSTVLIETLPAAFQMEEIEAANTAAFDKVRAWQWLTHGASVEMDGGYKETLTERLYQRLYAEELAKLEAEQGEANFNAQRFPEAAEIFNETATADILPDFLTIPAYAILEQ